MKCKNHPDDFTSDVGVCASCLHDRLIALMAAQVQLHLHHRPPSSDTQFLPPPRPNSLQQNPESPPAALHHKRFHSTPLAGPALLAIQHDRKTPPPTTANNNNKKNNKSLFWGLFRSKSDNSSSDLDSDNQFRSCMASPSWFSNIIPSRRRNQNRTFSLDETTSVAGAAAMRNPCRRRNRCRGMSPARCSDDEEEDGHFPGGSSGYSSESSQGWKQTPRRTPATARRCQGKASGNSRNVSGLAFCLSPLVRPSPNRNWNQKGVAPEIVVLAGAPAAGPFSKNRSRKIADFGRQSFQTRRQ